MSEENQESVQPDYSSMSDEDFGALAHPVEPELEVTPVSDDLDEHTITPEEEDGHEEDALASDDDDQSDDLDTDLDPEDNEEDEVTPADADTMSSDFETQIQALLAPFKANGKDMAVKSVDEARTLMQMGANYNKKMAGLKPNLKLMKMLQNNGLLEEGKLNHLIDLDKHDPKAISKLISDSKLDPLDIDVSSSADYQANTYAVSDEQVLLDDVLDSIKGTSHYNETTELLGNTWDKASQEIVVKNPEVIRQIQEQMANGTYAKVSAEVEHRRMMNGLQGVSDIEAYRLVGEEMYAEQTPVQSPSANVSPTKVIKAKQDPKLNARKRAASTTKSTPKTDGPSKDFNPLAMSDEDFDKLLASGQFA